MSSIKRQRFRLEKYQEIYLRKEYEKNKVWSSRKMEDIAHKLDIPKLKVYKWNWD